MGHREESDHGSTTREEQADQLRHDETIWWQRRGFIATVLVGVLVVVIAMAQLVVAVDVDGPGTASPSEPLGGPGGSLTGCGVDDVPAIEGAGWGPERPTFVMAEPATYATLNSITDNPAYGDERAFFDVRDVDDEGGRYCNSMQVSDGEVLRLRTYIQNSAAPNLDAQALDTTLTLVADERPSSAQVVRSELTSSTTSPEVVYDAVFLVAPSTFRIDYIPGSAMAYSNAHRDGIGLPDTIWEGSGARLGVDGDGVVGPTSEDVWTVHVKVRITYVLPS
ncbi:MAG: hypothetical protein GY788_13865 [bacterium]|nr:hypothetical protein [bacterium]